MKWSLSKLRKRLRGNADLYATEQDFQVVISTNIDRLFRLALLLTASVRLAEDCLIATIKECFNESVVFREWAEPWVRRTVVRNAIRMVLHPEHQDSNELSSDDGLEIRIDHVEHNEQSCLESEAIMALPDFDRLVYVICMLENHSVYECALLLSRSQMSVSEALSRNATTISSSTIPGASDAGMVCRPCQPLHWKHEIRWKDTEASTAPELSSNPPTAKVRFRDSACSVLLWEHLGAFAYTEQRKSRN